MTTSLVRALSAAWVGVFVSEADSWRTTSASPRTPSAYFSKVCLSRPAAFMMFVLVVAIGCRSNTTAGRDKDPAQADGPILRLGFLFDDDDWSIVPSVKEHDSTRYWLERFPLVSIDTH